MGKQNFQKAKLEDASAAALESVSGKQTQTEEGCKASEAKATNATAEATTVKGIDMPKVATNTKKIAELVSGGASPSVGVAAPALKAAGRIQYSGGADNVSGDQSATIGGTAVSRSGSRPGRQLDTALSHIDDVPAETFVVNINSIPDIASGESAVGYNGKYRNAHAISQKGSGGSPADSDFFRTLDECQYDMIYFGRGQHVDGVDNPLTVINGKTSYFDKDGDKTWKWGNLNITQGNYMPKKLHLEFTKDGLTALSFVVDDIACKDQPESIIRVAADTLIRENNLAELDRLAIIDESGDETKEGWSPLGKVQPNAKANNQIIGEVDKSIGDILFLCGSKLSTALAYQNNKAAKDGMRKIGPMFEMMEGNCETSHTRHSFAADDERLNSMSLFSDNDVLSAGSAALYVIIQDSLQKYNTKGKLLSLPLSFKTALSTFKQNCGEFRMHETFYNEFNRQEVFGKLDADDTGLTPYFITDGAKVCTPVNIFTDENLVKETYENPILNIRYGDLRNSYEEHIWNYFIAGLRKYIQRYAHKIFDHMKKNDGNNAKNTYVIDIPCTSTTTCLSMWDVLVCAAAKDIALERRHAMNAIVTYEANHKYPYHGALKLGDITIGGTSNVGFVDISSPLQSRSVPLNVGARVLMPETFWLRGIGRDDELVPGQVDGTYVLGKVVVPWYFSQNQFKPYKKDKDTNWKWAINPDEMSSMTFLDSRGGINLGNVERITSMDPEQLKLCMDRMVTMPALDKAQFEDISFGRGAKDLHVTAYKYSYHEDGIPEVLYRIFWTESSKTDILTIKDVLSTPRELGLSFIAPAGVVTPVPDVDTSYKNNYRDVESSYLGKSGPSFRIRFWTATKLSEIGHTLFDQKRENGAAANLKAKYYVIHAIPTDVSRDIGIMLTANVNGGLALSNEFTQPCTIVIGDGSYIDETGHYKDAEEKVISEKPSGYKGDLSTVDISMHNAKVVSTLKYLYTRLNYLPFVINPFDMNTKVIEDKKYGATDNKMPACNNYDPFDFLHLFNVCGFRCGEYSAKEYDRNKMRIELGLGYVADPYINSRN